MPGGTPTDHHRHQHQHPCPSRMWVALRPWTLAIYNREPPSTTLAALILERAEANNNISTKPCACSDGPLCLDRAACLSTRWTTSWWTTPWDGHGLLRGRLGRGPGAAAAAREGGMSMKRGYRVELSWWCSSTILAVRGHRFFLSSSTCGSWLSLAGEIYTDEQGRVVWHSSFT